MNSTTVTSTNRTDAFVGQLARLWIGHRDVEGLDNAAQLKLLGHVAEAVSLDLSQVVANGVSRDFQTTSAYPRSTEGNVSLTKKNNSTDTFCAARDEFTTENTLLIFGPALFALLLLSFLLKRQNVKKHCLGGRPAIVYPINFVNEHYETIDKIGYGACFFFVAESMVKLVLKQYIVVLPFQKDEELMRRFGFLNIFAALLNVLVITIVFCPLFVSITLKKSRIANVVGILYGFMWLSLQLHWLKVCYPAPPDTETQLKKIEQFLSMSPKKKIDLLTEIPIIAAMCVAIVIFIMHLYGNLRRRRKSIKMDGGVLPINHCSRSCQYVNTLLHKVPIEAKRSRWERWKYAIRYTSTPGFQYPPRVLFTMLVSCITLYRVAAGMIILVGGIIQDIQVKSSHDITKDQLLYQLMVMSTSYRIKVARDVYAIINDINTSLEISFYLSTAVSFIIILSFIIRMVVNYRSHVLLLLKGYRIASSSSYNPSPEALTFASLKYSGWQLAFIMISFFIYVVALTATAMFLSMFIIIPLKYGYTNFFLEKLKDLGPTAALSILLFLIQKTLVRYVFLDKQDCKRTANTCWKNVALTNLRLYHLFAFFAFFLNVIIGIFAVLQRCILACGTSLFYLCRLDCTVLARQFEWLDYPHEAYLGMLHLEVSQNSPVLRAFVELLCSSAARRAKGSRKEQKRLARKNTIKNRWLNIYTVLRNPGLTTLKKCNLKKRLRYTAKGLKWIEVKE